MAATGTTEDIETTDSAQLHEEGSLNKSLLSVLSAMQENLVSSNSLLRDLVESKRKSSEMAPASKRAKLGSGESSNATNASEKALNTSDEVIIEVSDKETDPASEEAINNAKVPDDDRLSLLSGEGSLDELARG